MDWILNWTELNGYAETHVRELYDICLSITFTLRIRARTRINSGEEFKDLSTFSPPVYYAPQYDLTHEKFYGKCACVWLCAHWPLREPRLNEAKKTWATNCCNERLIFSVLFVLKKINRICSLFKFVCPFLHIWTDSMHSIRRTSSDLGIVLCSVSWKLCKAKTSTFWILHLFHPFHRQQQVN